MSSGIENIRGKYLNLEKFGIDVYVEHYGSANDKNPLVFIHTAGADGRQWHDILLKMPQNRRYILIDLPGHGKTYPVNWKPIYTLNDYVDIFDEIIMALRINDFYLVGAAVGSRIAISYGVTKGLKKINGIALFSPAHYLVGDWYGSAGSFQRDLPDSLSIACWFLELSSKKALPPNLSKVSWFPLQNAYEVGISDEISGTLDVRDGLKAVEYPVLLIRGKDDPLIQREHLEDMQQYIKNCRISEVQNAGLFLHVENPNECSKLLIEFTGITGNSSR